MMDFYFMNRRTEMMNKAAQMGIFNEQSGPWLDMHGVPDENPEWIKKYIAVPNYRNPMKP